jgi:glycosyltransferase involved in cell wall biosynthesis
MNEKPLLTIAIPTYQRAGFLKNLLEVILPQAHAMHGMIQVCISDNGSNDNTREIVLDAKKTYGELIIYHEHKKNTGHDNNMLTVMEMSLGKFVWLLGDDDMIAPHGIEKVIYGIKNFCNEHTGLVIMSHQSYFIDEKTGQEVVYFETKDSNKPSAYPIATKDIMGLRSENSFLSVLLFNNDFLKKVLQEEKAAIQEAMGTGYLHAFIAQLMLLKYSELQIMKYNEVIIREALHGYKFYVEDKFKLYYVGWNRFDNLLLSNKYMTPFYRTVIVREKKKLRRRALKEMALMKAFGTFNYVSFLGCINLFFNQAPLLDAVIFSVFFAIISLTPSWFIKSGYKMFIKVKYKNTWQTVWLHIVVSQEMMSKGERRLVY